ncbi:MAG TPA: hypothetical protein VJ799_01005 [Nitrososphaeraceae archaeon]|nr:hypothetical protein [Nitrososphaeraceae archaeon]
MRYTSHKQLTPKLKSKIVAKVARHRLLPVAVIMMIIILVIVAMTHYIYGMTSLPQNLQQLRPIRER